MKRKWIIIAAMMLAVAMLFSLPLVGCKTTSATTTTAAAETTTAAATTTTATSETKKVEGAVLSMMHDKGGNPNYQPYFEEMGAKTKEVLGIDIKPVAILLLMYLWQLFELLLQLRKHLIFLPGGQPTE